MSVFSIILTITGLCLFEIISSLDNAIINASMLTSMHVKARRWFSTWGLFFAVFVVRGLLPWFIVWVMNPMLGPIGAFTSVLSSDPRVQQSMELSSPFLLVSGGTFLYCLFLHWFLAEKKAYALPIEKISERLFHEEPVWFYLFLFVSIDGVAFYLLGKNPYLAFGVMLGTTFFFILEGFKEHADKRKKTLLAHPMSDMAKIIFLEILDASFSVDGVIGAFAFTLSVPLILLGNGLGALVVRKLTLGNLKIIKHYPYLKNGAMYSMGILGTLMIAESSGFHISPLYAPLSTFVIVGYFLWRSHRHARRVGDIT